MHARVFLILTRAGDARLTKRAPRLVRGEIGLRVLVVIPDECFAGPFVDVALEVASDQVSPAECAVMIEDQRGGT
jgi:hypothetical protein